MFRFFENRALIQPHRGIQYSLGDWQATTASNPEKVKAYWKYALNKEFGKPAGQDLANIKQTLKTVTNLTSEDELAKEVDRTLCKWFENFNFGTEQHPDYLHKLGNVILEWNSDHTKATIYLDRFYVIIPTDPTDPFSNDLEELVHELSYEHCCYFAYKIIMLPLNNTHDNVNNNQTALFST